jgi:hypothetical protein
MFPGSNRTVEEKLTRWNTRTAIKQAPWDAPVDPLEGVVFHEFSVKN